MSHFEKALKRHTSINDEQLYNLKKIYDKSSPYVISVDVYNKSTFLEAKLLMNDNSYLIVEIGRDAHTRILSQNTHRTISRIRDYCNLNLDLIETTTDGFLFRKNVINETKQEALESLLPLIENQKLLIGRKAYKYKKSFKYSSDFCNQGMNQTESESVEYTSKMFDEFLIKYINYRIEFIEKELLERPITSNSTNKLNNLIFEWKLETKQELLKIYRTLI